ncbi:MAG: S26 family signal peptidase [Cytophagales bacterium]|nr:S26 family signal peptidase [Cytophagales bacterium]
MPSYRLPGLRKVKLGEPVVFNVPKDLLDPTERPIDLKTYIVKRCVAVAGDVLEIRDKNIIINGEANMNPEGLKYSYLVEAKDQLNNRTLSEWGLGSDDSMCLGNNSENKPVYRMVLTSDELVEIKLEPFILSVEEPTSNGSGTSLFPSMMSTWTDKNYGPLKIPAKGMSIDVNDSTLNIYGEIINNYEGHSEVNIHEGHLTIDGKEVHTYVFQQDYYFYDG